ncbi:MAG: sugar phosphate isomerase/epimerase [Acidobacteriia bacterium]|nr:sugar phosphate isomerase/epimerase [Terriglobia bacterium]
MAKNVELIVTYWTLAGGAQPHTDHEYSDFDFKDRVEAAAKVGFKGFGLWHSDLDHVLQKYTLQDMKRILDDNGMKHIEVEFLADWFLKGEMKRLSDIRKRKLLTVSEVLGARHIKVGDFEHKTTPMPQVIESFAALCKDAAEHGARIVYELMPFAMIDTLEDALTMLKGAGAKNGGIIFDMWHVAKLGIPYEKISSFPMEYFFAVELNDGTFTAPWDLVEDTVNHRRLCGEGEFDIPGFLDAVSKAGYRGPIGVEVLNKELRSRPLDELVTRAYNTTMAQFRP